MQWCNQFDIGSIIIVIESLFYTLIIKPYDTLSPKINLIVDKQNGVDFFNYLPST